jgi:hypothetical protein
MRLGFQESFGELKTSILLLILEEIEHKSEIHGDIVVPDFYVIADYTG